MSEYAFIQSMRWFGPNDPVPLDHIRQAGCTGVVTALHDIPVGDIWPDKNIKEHLNMIQEAGLTWTVVESLPVHEAIKTRTGNFQLYIENYKQSLRNLAAKGINVITYNFMPILDWLRTDVSWTLPDKSEALFFNKLDYDIFDLFLLQRPDAEKDYSPKDLEKINCYWAHTSEEKKEGLFKNMLLGLPGSSVPFTRSEILNKLDAYKNIDNLKLKEHLILFLKEITPTADEIGVRMAIHPDDPPYSVLGLPRIMSTEEDIADIIKAVPNKSNGLCFCTGSYGARPDNHLNQMVEKWGPRIYFLHFRNTSRDQNGNFYEANHLEGDTDMYEIVKAAVHIMHGEKRSIPMRPDHGHKMLDDLAKTTYPGYSAIGRLKGLAEIRGLEYAIQRALKKSEN